MYNEDRIIETESASIVTLPLMALRGLIALPEMVMSFDVERTRSIAAIEAAVKEDRLVFLTAQKEVLKEYPTRDDLYDMGVVCRIRQYIRTQENGMRIMLEGQNRARIVEYTDGEQYPTVTLSIIPAEPAEADTPEKEALLRSAIALFDEYSAGSGSVLPETLISLSMRSDLGYCADYMIQNSFLKHTVKQELLEILDPAQRLDSVCDVLAHEVSVQKVENEINEKLRTHLMHTQRENILREQIRVIQAELGDGEESEVDRYRTRILEASLSDDITERLLKETDRLAKQPFGSAEGAVIRGYLDTVLELPWHNKTKERLDIAAAAKILDDDHYGLEKVKERILEFLAVRKMAPEIKGGILCLVGPPGVGKTSIAISIAKATNRKLARVSLGGVHDEAEIRGHRKTYIGAMPGRIMTALKDAKTKNPLMLFDEIDKLGSDYKGDPASALLEALDPEQNGEFRDHYIEVPFDLSEALFITTANTIDTIPRPLLDRMEVIELSSYTDEEKLQIAKRHLLPKQRKKHGLDGRTLRVGDDVIREIIAGYTRESGVRQLERQLAALCRKTDMKIVSGEKKSLTVRAGMLEELLGVRRYKPELLAGRDEIGLVNGLAWTSVGGTLLEVEAAVLDGTGKLELTGNLGDVMKESARAAISCIRSRCDKLCIDKEFYKNRDIHLHFPEGAVPKDGPSAGITIAIALISALTGNPVRRDVAMTGEISLNGRIMPIGGLKEKTMAAFRSGVKTVIIPEDNVRDLEEIDQTVRRALNFVPVSKIDEAIPVAIVMPEVFKAEESFAVTGARNLNAPSATIRQ